MTQQLKERSELNPGQKDYQEKVAPQSHPADNGAPLSDDERRSFDDIAANYKDTAVGDDVPHAEKQVADRSPGFQYTPKEKGSDGSSSGGNALANIGAGAKKNKKFLAVAGIGIAGFFAAILLLIPFKLQSILADITSQAANIPEHIIENRLNYLVAFYLANKMAPHIVDGKDIAQGNSVAAILFLNWQASKFEDKLGLKIESVERDGNGQATKWKLTARDESSIELQGDTNQISREIQGSRQMRNYLQREIRNTTKWNQVYKRYAMRKVLMNKFGVRSWRGPAKFENALDKYAEKKAQAKRTIKKRLVNATIGRIAPNYSRYLACMIDGGDECEKLRDPNYSTTVEPAPATDTVPSDEELEQRAREELGDDATDAQIQDRVDELRADYEAAGGALDDAANTDIDGLADEVLDGEGGDGPDASRIITKELIKKIAVSGVAGLGIVELMSNMVDGINEGRVNEIVYAMNSQAYVGFSTEMLTLNDKFKAGDLDIATMGATMDIINRVEDSPLQQHEMGSQRGKNTPVFRDCDGDGTKEELPQGQYICPDKLAAQDITEFIKEEPYKAYWNGITKVNDFYKSTVGDIVDFFTELLDDIVGATIGPLLEWLVEKTGLGDLVEKMLDWVMGLIFVPPVNGMEVGGAAYDAISGGVRSSYNGLMEAGVDSEGKAAGGGGRHLTNEEIAVLQQDIYQQEHEEFMQQSFYARLFDPNLRGSLLQGLILRTPTDIAGTIGNPILSLSSIMVPRSLAAASNVINPFNSMIAGYTDGDDYIEKDPAIYAQESCDESRQARNDSYTRDAIPGNDTDKDTPVAVPTKADPCALEKLVAGIGSAMFTNDPSEDYALGGEAGPGEQIPDADADAPPPAAAATYKWPVSFAALDFVTITNCWRNSNTGNGHTGIDMAVPEGTVVKAANSGEVVLAGEGGDAGKVVMIKHSDGRWSNYQHLSKISVSKGQNVVAGDVIGESGNTGNSSGPHLHFSITTAETLASRNNTTGSVDPLPYLEKIVGITIKCK